MNKTGLIAKMSIKYVLPTCIWKYCWRISQYFMFFGEFCGISRKYLNFAGPRLREISEALSMGQISDLLQPRKEDCNSFKLNWPDTVQHAV